MRDHVGWGRIVAGALLIVFGIGWLLSSAGLVDVPLRVFLPVVLIVIGVTLLARSRYGSHTGLIVVGIVLIAIMLGDNPARTFSIGNGRSTNVGDHSVTPTDVSQLRPYRLSAGTLHIDLTKLPLEPQTYVVSARVGAGRIDVVVPRGIPLRVSARSGLGSVDVLGNVHSGVGAVNDTYRSPDYGEARPRLDLSLRTGVGSISVTSAEGLMQPTPSVPETPVPSATA